VQTRHLSLSIESSLSSLLLLITCSNLQYIDVMCDDAHSLDGSSANTISGPTSPFYDTTSLHPTAVFNSPCTGKYGRHG
jgi:hypothetical protein